ncbi:MAG: nucleotidyl transferase AbiEii/AbiGii toxin family protein [Actinomycetota bacterium]
MRSAHAQVAAIAAATKRDRLLIAARRGEPMDEPADQLAALLDAGRALEEAGVPYALIGGVAVGIHSGAPRATEDIDIAVTASLSRGAVIEALTAAGFELEGEFPHSLNLRHAGGERVQLAIDPWFDEMIERAETVTVGPASIRLVSRNDLIAMKERSSSDPARRPSKALRDRADVALLRGDVEGPDEGW